MNRVLLPSSMAATRLCCSFSTFLFLTGMNHIFQGVEDRSSAGERAVADPVLKGNFSRKMSMFATQAAFQSRSL